MKTNQSRRRLNDLVVLVIVVGVLLVFDRGQLCAASAVPKQQLQHELTKLIESQSGRCDDDLFRKINQLGRLADGEFGEFYGERLFSLLAKDTTSGCFMKYLLFSEVGDRTFIMKALRYEAQIRDSKNPCGQIQVLIDSYKARISATQRKLIARRLCPKKRD